MLAAFFYFFYDLFSPSILLQLNLIFKKNLMKKIVRVTKKIDFIDNVVFAIAMVVLISVYIVAMTI